MVYGCVYGYVSPPSPKTPAPKPPYPSFLPTEDHPVHITSCYTTNTGVIDNDSPCTLPEKTRIRLAARSPPCRSFHRELVGNTVYKVELNQIKLSIRMTHHILWLAWVPYRIKELAAVPDGPDPPKKNNKPTDLTWEYMQ